jgi:outer membrane immunogenic protein
MLRNAAIALLLTTSSAVAADLRYQPDTYRIGKDFSWTALYVGLNGGYGSSSTNGADLKGGFGGIQGGFNYQWNMLVTGFEADFTGGRISQTTNLFGFANVTEQINGMATFRGRLGVAIDRVLVYGTAGYAIANASAEFNVLGQRFSSSHGHSGAVYGGGLEVAFADNWTVKGEYLRASFNSQNYFNDLVAGGIPSGKFDVDIFKVGVNYLLR